jgi:hypothetical protein
MALLFFDGFEGYSTPDDAEGKGIIATLNRDTWSFQTGRNGGKCLRYKANNVYPGDFVLGIPTISQDYSAIIGFAVKFAHHFEAVQGAAEAFLKFGVSDYSYLRIDNDDSGNLQIGFWADGQWKSPENFKLQADRWYYIECKVKFNPSTGAGQVKIDEQLIYDYTGDNVTTSNDFSPYDVSYARFRFGYDYQTAEQNVQVDDFYLADSSGASNNDFLGDIRIDAIHPNGAGNYSQFTPSAGSNYQCVDEVGADESDYVEAAVDGYKDSYAFPNVPTDLDDADIKAVQIRTFSQRTATADNRKITPFIRTGSTDYSQSDVSLADSFGEARGDIVLLDPSDSNPWTQAKINACEFGMEVGT